MTGSFKHTVEDLTIRADTYGAAVAQRLNINQEKAAILVKLFDPENRGVPNANIVFSEEALISYVQLGSGLSDVKPNTLFDSDFYLENNPDVLLANFNPFLHFVLHGATEGRSPHPLFDLQWYVQHYSASIGREDNPLLHFVMAGAASGFDPHPLFSMQHYLEQDTDIQTAGFNPLLHYVTKGWKEGRDPHPLFSTRNYLDENLDVKIAGINPLAHYVSYGWKDGRNPHPLFSTRFYLGRYEDVAAAGVEPLAHYLQHGAKEGYDPHPLFSTIGYSRHNADVQDAEINSLVHYVTDGSNDIRDPHTLLSSSNYLDENLFENIAKMNPLVHYVSHGWKDGRNPHPLFNSSFYLNRYEDVAGAGVEPLAHYIQHGAKEDRDPHPLFSTSWYIRENPDVLHTNINPLVHYCLTGASDGRDPGPDFCSAFYWKANGFDKSSVQNPLLHYVEIGKRDGALIDTSQCVQREWRAANGPDWDKSFHMRLNQRMSRLAMIDLTPPFRGNQKTFSIITTVFDTPAGMLEALARSLREQAFGDFEWVILDNGSTLIDTIEGCRSIAESDKRFFLHRVEDNLHIIGGNRYVFERATGRYIVPVDSDDILYPDSLALFADALRASADDPPIFLYSDEQKIDIDGEPLELIARNDYSLAHGMSTVPAAHLSVYSRDAGLAAEVYSDDYARGSHDWDTALRITERGAKTEHIPEVLYGWRVHETSTAFHPNAKSYINDFQIEVLHRSLKRRGIENKFDIENLFYQTAGYYQAVRNEIETPATAIDFVIPSEMINLGATEHNINLLKETTARKTVCYPSALKSSILDLRARIVGIDEWVEYQDDALPLSLNKVMPKEFCKLIVSSGVWLISHAAATEATGLLELDPRAGIVGGLLKLFNGMVLSSGLLAGLDDFLSSPFYGWAEKRIPPHLTLPRRPVTAFPAIVLGVRADLLRSGIGLTSIDYDDSINGIRFCLAAASKGYSSIFDRALCGNTVIRLKKYPGAGSADRVEIKRRFLSQLAKQAFSTHFVKSGENFGAIQSSHDAGMEINRYDAQISPAILLNVQPLLELDQHPTINVLLPAVRSISLSGGPNTALNLAYRLAELGFAVRLVSTDVPIDADLGPVWTSILALSGRTQRLSNLAIVDASDRSIPFHIGANDIILATAWWTAVMADAIGPLVGNKPFIYLIQDFEPILYPASFSYALSYQSYHRPHIAMVNTSLLKDYFIENKVGLFSDPAHVEADLQFEPAIDRMKFYPQIVRRKRHRLLFYARSTAPRNLFELGLKALKALVREHVLDASRWDIVGMGEQFASLDLGFGSILECAPWLGIDEYAEQMRTSDILLSLMLSPHPSYPPLEMAGCGGLVVTNTYATKTADRLKAISANIIAVEPNVADIVRGIEEAISRLDDFEARQVASFTGLPSSWDESFASVIPALAARIRAFGIQSDAATRVPAGEPRHLRLPKADRRSAYDVFLKEAAARRASNNAGVIEPGLFSFVTTVWNTAPAYLDVLMRSLEGQLGGVWFEWIILDNGTTRKDTIAWMADAERRPFVSLSRVEENLGIIGGMSYVLERASGRYILPLDADDYLYPDCVRTLAWYAQKHAYPALLYTDEDKLVREQLSVPFCKPDWDPVLFSAQCFIAHLCVIDRKLALQLGAYSDPRPEGSHDWDTFTRFHLAGYKPVHVPHVLYSWRQHPQSTAGGNVASKPVVFDSQRAVLERFLAGSPRSDQFELLESPLFDKTPDWWLRRKRANGRSITSVRVRASWDTAPERDLRISENLDHEVHEIALEAGLSALRLIVAEAALAKRLVHIVASEVQPDDDEWPWEAMGLFDLFPDTVAVGGRIYSYGTILEAGRFLGFGDGCGCPDRGRLLTDPGHSAQMWKPRSVDAVSAMHGVFDANMLLTAIDRASYAGGSIAGLGNWVGAEARRTGRRVVYSPFLCAWTGTDWNAIVDAKERRWFISAYIDLMTGSGLRPSNSGNTVDTAYEPVQPASRYMPPPDVGLPSYAEWIARVTDYRLAAKAKQTKVAIREVEPFFSLLSTLYIKTDVELFRLTAESVSAQTYPEFEWVVLTHGPTSAELETLLSRVATDRRVRLLRLPDNLGIVGGMRHVLESATGTYTVSLDGDDLLEPEALALLARAIADHGAPDFLYTNEDIVVGESRQSPFLRPAWDPVLDLENSWIWHLCAMKRTRALELGVYTDRHAEYCHDWDSVDRFVGAGAKPIHVPHIAYSWRHHERSTSNTDGPNELSGKSVQHVLNRKIERLGLSRVATVADYPIWRGAKEYWISRKAENLPPLIALAASDAAAPPLFSTEAMPTFGSRELLQAIAHAEPDAIIAFVAKGIICRENAAALEVIKLFECVPDVLAVTGRISIEGRIHSAGYLCDGSGGVIPMLHDKAVGDPGAFALAWKPQCIAAPASELFFVRAVIMRRALAAMPSHVTRGEIGLWLGVFAAAEGKRVCFSPLVAAESLPTSSVHDRISSNLAWRSFRARYDIKTEDRQGDSGYWQPRWST